jgi:3-methylcrotonyl-CoA carboxylase alpha subunit
MPGRVISVLATLGQVVEAGAPLVILEAMKMEHTIRSPYSGVVEEIFFGAGDFVEEGVELARVKAA